ncbi:hypothetical protein L873DRAFT_1034262 [Choiromyces venosus 120613-1]|uniref:Uncharacterized protein n=1 Tax=Choiromyces venosus 120613-1 TaxID=1336337 RepID=A0A3N4JJV8_9PEZI|nr:hypothetical protein L873DRAFT_1034262 [Choiromyces venosus 120613-1]
MIRSDKLDILSTVQALGIKMSSKVWWNNPIVWIYERSSCITFLDEDKARDYCIRSKQKREELRHHQPSQNCVNIHITCMIKGIYVYFLLSGPYLMKAFSYSS